MTKKDALNGKPYAGNPHVRFDEGEAASTATSRRGSLLYNMNRLITVAAIAASAMAVNASSIAIDSVQQRWPWNNKVRPRRDNHCSIFHCSIFLT